jgi:hypothetical protein
MLVCGGIRMCAADRLSQATFLYLRNNAPFTATMSEKKDEPLALRLSVATLAFVRQRLRWL